MKIELPENIMLLKQMEHCPHCVEDDKVFCPRDMDVACLECGECFCAGHIALHLRIKHFIVTSMAHCSN